MRLALLGSLMLVLVGVAPDARGQAPAGSPPFGTPATVPTWPQPGVPPTPQPRAEPDRHRTWFERPLYVLVQGGVGTPTGAFGLTAGYDVVPYLIVEAGIGVGTMVERHSHVNPVDGANPLQLAAGLRLRVPVEALAVSVGAGLSRGGYERRAHLFADPTEADLYIWDPAEWANFDIAIEGRNIRGFQWRAFWGVGKLLNHQASTRCQSSYEGGTCAWNGQSVSIFYLGAAVGYAFGL